MRTGLAGHEQPRKLVVVGQGYVGLPLAVAAVEAGYHVLGIDIDRARVRRLRRGESYVDDIPDSRLRDALDTGRYLVSTDHTGAAGFTAAVIAVPTPLRDGCPDLSLVAQAGRDLAPHLTRGSLVVLESTTYPGTTEDLLRPILEQGSGLTAGEDFALGYSPERIDPGNATWTLASTPKVVAGIDAASLAGVEEFYRKLVADVIPVSCTRAAELTKLLENTFRHVNIALVNEFALFARELGVDIWEVVQAASSKPFGFMPFYPGPGVGGHCLPVDPTYLSWHVQRATGQRFRFIELANDINEHMPDYVVRRVIEGLNRAGKAVSDSVVLLLGCAYKKNSSDAREVPASRVAQLLASLGASLGVVDDHVAVLPCGAEATRVELTAEAVRAADAVVLLTDHDDVDYPLVQREASWILDCRNRLSGANVESLWGWAPHMGGGDGVRHRQHQRRGLRTFGSQPGGSYDSEGSGPAGSGSAASIFAAPANRVPRFGSILGTELRVRWDQWPWVIWRPRGRKGRVPERIR
jgi:UDP-N-acetyl-D-glucosamine dehydrogenase